jgi:hypothetical protein
MGFISFPSVIGCAAENFTVYDKKVKLFRVIDSLTQCHVLFSEEGAADALRLGDLSAAMLKIRRRYSRLG